MADRRRVRRGTRTTSGVRSGAVVLGACGLLAVGLVTAVARPAAPAAAQGAPVAAAARTSQLSQLAPLGALTQVAAAPATAATATAATAAAATAPGSSLPLPTQPYSDCTNTDGKPYATGLPPLPCLLYPPAQPGKSITAWTDNGALFDDIVQKVLRADLEVPLDKSVSRIYTLLCNAPGGPRPCPPQFSFVYPPVGSPYRSGFFGTVGYAFLQSPIGDSPQYGTVTRKGVSLYGFGSIPSSATLTVSQPLVNGVADPLVLQFPSFSPLYPKGTVIPGYEQFGPCCGSDPKTGVERKGPAQLVGDLSIRGPVVITVSDVKLDGVALDVGSHCQASTTLQLTAKGGWILPPSDPSHPKPVEFYPGEYQPFNPPSYVHAGLPGVDPDPDHPLPAGYHYTGVDVPAFTGCVGATGDDVSSLVTGLASGKANPLDLVQKTIFTPFGCLAGNVPNCGTQHPAVVPPDKVVLPK